METTVSFDNNCSKKQLRSKLQEDVVAYTCFDNIALDGPHNYQNDQSAEANFMKDSIGVPKRIANYLLNNKNIDWIMNTISTKNTTNAGTYNIVNIGVESFVFTKQQ